LTLSAVNVVLHQNISAHRNWVSERILFDCATGQSFSSTWGT
jgi:hypothetical protein